MGIRKGSTVGKSQSHLGNEVSFSPLVGCICKALFAANEKLVKDAAHARDLAREMNDPESQDLMIGGITLHKKTASMLKCFLM